MSRFEQEFMGRGPKDVRVHLMDDMVVVRLKGVLTAAEKHTGQDTSAREGQRSAQAGAHPPDRDSAADHGGDGGGDYGR